MKAKAYNTTKNFAAVPVREDTSGGFFAYEKPTSTRNGLPVCLIDWTEDSPTAQACIDKIREFVIADGFSENGDQQVDLMGTTANELLMQLAFQQSVFDAFSLKIGKSRKKSVRDARIFPFEWLRKSKDYDENGTFVYNRKMGMPGYRPQDNKRIAEYNNPNADRKSAIADGEILYSFTQDVGEFRRLYPLPSYYAGIGYLQADALLAKIEHENAANGFLPPTILTTIPEPSIERGEGKLSPLVLLQNEVKKFLGIGVQKRSRVLHLFANSKDDIADLKTFGEEIQMGIIDKATERIMTRICMMFNVPPVLIGKSTPGKQGENQELVNQMKLFQRSVKTRQMKISQAMVKVFGGEWPITKLDIIKFIPSQVFEVLTDNEIRQIADFEPVELDEYNKINVQ